MNKTLKYVIFVALLITLVSVVSATDTHDTNSVSSDVTTSTVSQNVDVTSNTQLVTTKSNNNENKKTNIYKNVTKKENNKETTPTKTDANLIKSNRNDEIKSEPENGGTFEMTDETYSTFFDNNGNLINTDVTNSSTLTFKGTFNDKIFKFDNINLTLTGDEAVINNGFISTDNNAVIKLGNVVFNNTKEGIENSILLNTDNNEIKSVTIYRTSTNGRSREIMVNGDDNIIQSNIFDLSIPVIPVDYSEYPFSMSETSAISVTGSRNTINSNRITVRNTTTSTGTISVIDFK